MLYTEALRTARKKAGLTQEEVAEILNISHSAICQFERGKGSEPSISRLIQLADIYKVSLDELVGRSQKKS